LAEPPPLQVGCKYLSHFDSPVQSRRTYKHGSLHGSSQQKLHRLLTYSVQCASNSTKRK
jgi:hypothetical protein